MTAFTSELSVVVYSTSAIAKLQLSTTINQLASSLPDLLLRELEYEYVGVRCDFLFGILAFIVATALRVRFALRRSKQLSWAVMWMILFSAESLLTYSNSYVTSYGGFTALLIRRIYLQASRV